MRAEGGLRDSLEYPQHASKTNVSLKKRVGGAAYRKNGFSVSSVWSLTGNRAGGVPAGKAQKTNWAQVEYLLGKKVGFTKGVKT